MDAAIRQSRNLPARKSRGTALIAVRFILLFAVFLLLGVLLHQTMAFPFYQGVNHAVCAYFTTPFADCTTPFSYAAAFTALCAGTLVCIALVYLASFTLLSAPVAGIIIAWQAASFGFSASYYLEAIRAGVFSAAAPTEAAFPLFLLIQSLLCIALLVTVILSAAFSYEARRGIASIRRLFHSGALYLHTRRTLAAAGAVVIIQLLRMLIAILLR